MELEKQFFDTFGIEPIEIPSREYNSDGEICSYYLEYPTITDRILLELICISLFYAGEYQLTHHITINELKDDVLQTLIYLNGDEEVISRIKTLFKENN